jgi:hypothetical protein
MMGPGVFRERIVPRLVGKTECLRVDVKNGSELSNRKVEQNPGKSGNFLACSTAVSVGSS